MGHSQTTCAWARTVAALGLPTFAAGVATAGASGGRGPVAVVVNAILIEFEVVKFAQVHAVVVALQVADRFHGLLLSGGAPRRLGKELLRAKSYKNGRSKTGIPNDGPRFALGGNTRQQTHWHRKRPGRNTVVLQGRRYPTTVVLQRIVVENARARILERHGSVSQSVNLIASHLHEFSLWRAVPSMSSVTHIPINRLPQC